MTRLESDHSKWEHIPCPDCRGGGCASCVGSGIAESIPLGCGRLMVGSGTDTYDPICELAEGHRGPCKSTAAIDQYRLVASDEFEVDRKDDDG